MWNSKFICVVWVCSWLSQLGWKGRGGGGHWGKGALWFSFLLSFLFLFCLSAQRSVIAMIPYTHYDLFLFFIVWSRKNKMCRSPPPPPPPSKHPGAARGRDSWHTLHKFLFLHDYWTKLDGVLRKILTIICYNIKILEHFQDWFILMVVAYWCRNSGYLFWDNLYYYYRRNCQRVNNYSKDRVIYRTELNFRQIEVGRSI